MSDSCSIWDPWQDHNWTPCFRENYLNTFLTLCIVVGSLTISCYQIKKELKRDVSHDKPFMFASQVTSNYGTIERTDDDTSSSSTVLSFEEKANVSKLDWIRSIFSIAQWILVLQIILYTKSDPTIDKSIEGSISDMMIMYYSCLCFWTYCSLYSILNLFFSSLHFRKNVSNLICSHLNYLYFFAFILNIINLSAYYQVHDIYQIDSRYQHEIISIVLVFALIILSMNEARYAPTKPVIADTGRVMSGERWSSLYSKIMFSWVEPMLKLGNQQTLNPDDLLELIPENRTKNTLESFRRHQRSRFALSLLATFKRPLAIQFVFCMGWSILMFGPPYFLNQIIKFIEHGDQSLSSAFLSVFMLFITSCANSLCYQQALYIGRSLGAQIQSVVVGEVYRKSLSRQPGTTNANTLLSVDSQKLGEIVSYIFYLYCFPLQVGICIWSLYRLLGKASLWGVLIMLGTQPVTYLLSRHFQRLQHQVLAWSDKRIRLMHELLSAIRIVKFFAWENQFRTRIMEARQAELGLIRSRLLSYMWIGNVWFLIPVLIMIAVFYGYTLDHLLTASTAFTALALFNNFKSALDQLPVVTSFLLQANVSLGRIESYLAQEDLGWMAGQEGRVGFERARFGWVPGQVTIDRLDFDFPIGRLSLVVGPTGAGKTSLILSLLGETWCGGGRALLPRKPLGLEGGAASGVAYVAQTAWLQNCSLRDNILFGLPYDRERYEKILYMTALTRDLDILEFGDATEVGEKGITLSGGQKQRVAIARAVYSQADIVLLDDCLSAVDAHTAKHIYEHCLMGEYMRHRTVILVTHHVGLCIPGASFVVAMDESGSIAASGKPLDVIRTGVLGEDVTEETYYAAKESVTVEGPIPVVPETIKDKTSKGGKLVQDEKREEGGVKWSVYGTYYHASGGFFFWASVIVLFCCAQASVVGQDYWIRIWSAAYDSAKGNAVQILNLVRRDYISSSTLLGEMGQSMLYSWSQTVPSSVIRLSGQLKDKNEVNVSYYLGVYFSIGMLSLALATLRSLVLYMGSLRASRHIHTQLLDKILRAKVRFFDTTPIGRIVNRFSSDLETIDQNLAPSLSYLIYTSIAAIYVILLISAITPAFILPAIVVALLFKRIGLYYLKTSRDLKRLNSVSRSPVYVHFNETNVGVATIRAFGAQLRFIQTNHTHIDNNNRPFLWMWATNRWLHCRVDCLGAFVGFLTGVVLLVSRSWISPGLAGLSLSYALTFTHHVLFVVRMYAINEMNMNAIERVHEYLEVEEEPSDSRPVEASWPQDGQLEVKDLVMQYAADTPAVLRGISFKTQPREKIGIVGRTGSGKSTLALSLFRFMEPTSGQVTIDGVDIHQVGLETLRSRLTIIPQDPVLFSGTLRSNLDPFGQYSDAALWAALKRSHLMDSPEVTVSLDSPVEENGSNWSQGQRQLIALARALVKKSALIVLDEATSSVDFDTDQQIQDTIRKEFNESTLLCIAHRIRTVVDYDRILVLDHGEIKEFDTPYALITRDGSIFQQMCQRSGEYNDLLAIAKNKFEQKA